MVDLAVNDAVVTIDGQETLAQLMRLRVAQWGDRIAMREKAFGIWQDYRWRDFDHHARRIAGGLFAANVDFTDHPVGARLAGEYPVVTVRSILRWLDASGMAVETMEWRRGRLQATPGPM